MEKIKRESGGTDRSIEQSPHHRHQAKSSGIAPHTPGRLKTKDESPDRAPAVPKFGEWEDSDPASADGFTGIFEKVREERQTGSGKVPHISDDSKYPSDYGHGGRKSSGCSCFGWLKK